MGFFEQFPYTNFHDLNLDWLLNAMKKLKQDFKDFAETNQLHYADPLEWSITTNYPAMTLVRDEETNYIYMSVQPVPAGVTLDNEDYWYRVGDMSAYAEQLDRLKEEIEGRVKQLVPECSIALLGDSTWKDDYAENWIPNFFENATVANYYTASSAYWYRLMDQVNSIVGTPDIIIINCGSNDVAPNQFSYDHGGGLGAPDVNKETYETGETTSFDAMREVIGTLRSNYPNALIFNLVRAEHPNRNKAVWHYLTYYQKQIMYKWGVPVIDANELINFTAWNQQQKNILTESDGQHYSELAIQRLSERFSTVINTGSPASAGFMEPYVFLTPASEINVSEARNSITNKIRAARWAVKHCQSLSSGDNVSHVDGTAYAYSSIGLTTARFSGWYDVTADSGEILLIDAGRVFKFTFTGDSISNAGPMIQLETITSSNAVPWYQLQDNDYIVRGTALASLGFPAAVIGNCFVQIRSNPDSAVSTFNPTYKYAVVTCMHNANTYKGNRLMSDGTEVWYRFQGTLIN